MERLMAKKAKTHERVGISNNWRKRCAQLIGEKFLSKYKGKFGKNIVQVRRSIKSLLGVTF
jgi:hypothetical protein